MLAQPPVRTVVNPARGWLTNTCAAAPYDTPTRETANTQKIFIRVV